MKLRYYQSEAITAAYRYLHGQPGNPLVCIPTGGGKTPVMAAICRHRSHFLNRRKPRILLISHVKELVEQTAKTLGHMLDGERVGINSAKLNRRDTENDIIVANIQSIFRTGLDLGPIDLLIVDEAHLVQPGQSGEGMYNALMRDLKIVNPHVRALGLTATPYRMTSGWICGPDNLFNHVCYEIGVKKLIEDGFLSPLVSKPSDIEIDTGSLTVIRGEYRRGEAENLMLMENHAERACAEAVKLTQGRASILVFCTGIDHAERVADILHRLTGDEVGEIYGSTATSKRDLLIQRFKGRVPGRSLFEPEQPQLRWLVNVEVLTTGFDAPNVDAVILLRPTASPGLYYQMVGRGFRIAPGKDDCMVLDYGRNIERHGPVDAIKIKNRRSTGNTSAPERMCPECGKLSLVQFRICPHCGHAFPEPEVTEGGEDTHSDTASDESVISEPPHDDEYEVLDVAYSIHEKKEAEDGKPAHTMRVDYRTGVNDYQSEWICIEHRGFAKTRAVKWWKARCRLPIPETVAEAVKLGMSGALATPTTITVTTTPGATYPERITGYQLLPPPTITDEMLDDSFDFGANASEDDEGDEAIAEGAGAGYDFLFNGDYPPF